MKNWTTALAILLGSLQFVVAQDAKQELSKKQSLEFSCGFSAIHPDEEPEESLLKAIKLVSAADTAAEDFFLKFFSKGIQHKDLSLKSAFEACSLAHQFEPTPQNSFRLSRTLIGENATSSDIDRARELASFAIQNDYPVAHLVLASIAQSFDKDIDAARRHFRLAHEAELKSGTAGLGLLLLSTAASDNERQTAISLLESVLEARPYIATTLARHWFAQSDEGDLWDRAISALEKAVSQNDEDAILLLAQAYGSRNFRLYHPAKAIELARRLANGKSKTDAYRVLFDTYYFDEGDAKNLPNARHYAVLGANERDAYLGYVAAHMMFYGQGGQSDYVRARKFAQNSIQYGQAEAGPLLELINAKINEIAAGASRAQRDCLVSADAFGDGGTTIFSNNCNKSVNAEFCTKGTATMLLGALNGKQIAWDCKRKFVEPGETIGLFYTAGQNHSNFRKLFSNGLVRVTLCYAPAIPVSQGDNNFICDVR